MAKGLGKGLEALIPAAEKPVSGEKEGVARIPVDKIKPNKYQPRTKFNDEKLHSLAESIKERGVIQPIIVSESVVPGEYELIAGERRLRAAEIAKLSKIPAVVRTVTDQERYQISLIENLQREDLSPIEEAKAYQNIMKEFGLTQDSLAKLLGSDRSVVANTLRLLNLSEEIQDMISEGLISPGHGRMLAGVGSESKQKGLVKRILREKLTVREIEEIVKNWKTSGKTATGKRKRQAEIVDLENDLQRTLGTKVLVNARGTKGKITIFFWSLDELNKILKILRTQKTHKR
jgi:ParB family chromosome partitioning protein